MNYKESHIFPSGLRIDLYSELAKQYIEDSDLENLENKWKYIFPELRGISERINFEIFKELKNSLDVQKKFAEAFAIDYLNLLLPRTLIHFIIIADKFGVPIGTVIFQLWNHGNFIEDKEGYWILNKDKII